MTRELRNRIRRLETKSPSLIEEFRHKPLEELTDQQLFLIATEGLQGEFGDVSQITDEELLAIANGEPPPRPRKP